MKLLQRTAAHRVYRPNVHTLCGNTQLELTTFLSYRKFALYKLIPF